MKSGNPYTIAVTLHFETDSDVDPSLLDHLGQQLEHCIEQLRADGQLTPVDTANDTDIRLTAIRSEVDPQSQPLQMVIHLAGGLVEDVMCDGVLPVAIDVAVMDYDTDGANEDEIVDVVQPDGDSAGACVRFISISSPVIDLKQLFAARISDDAAEYCR